MRSIAKLKQAIIEWAEAEGETHPRDFDADEDRQKVERPPQQLHTGYGLMAACTPTHLRFLARLKGPESELGEKLLGLLRWGMSPLVLSYL